jgi:putative transposase
MRYRFVAAERATFPVRRLCRLVGVAASGFYAWLRRGPGRRAGEDAGLAGRIAAIFEASRRTYGSPRIHAELREDGVRIGRGRVARLMRRGGLTAARRRRVPRTTDSRHDHPVAPNLLGRNFAADRPDAVWLADISYVSLPRPRGHPVKVRHAAPAICSWAWAGVKKPRPECRRRRL